MAFFRMMLNRMTFKRMALSTMSSFRMMLNRKPINEMTLSRATFQVMMLRRIGRSFGIMTLSRTAFCRIMLRRITLSKITLIRMPQHNGIWDNDTQHCKQHSTVKCIAE